MSGGETAPTMSSAKQSFDGDAIASVSKAYPVVANAAAPGSEDEASKTASVNDDAKSQRNTKSPFEVPVGEAGVGAVSRKLSSRHIQMIGIGGGIGTGLFVGSGIALANAGPVGVLLAYIITGMMIFGVMEGLAEMSERTTEIRDEHRYVRSRHPPAASHHRSTPPAFRWSRHRKPKMCSSVTSSI